MCLCSSNLFRGFRDRTRLQWDMDDVFSPPKSLLFLGLKQRSDHGDRVQDPEEWVAFFPRGLCCWPPGSLFSGVLWRGGGGGRSRNGWRGDLLSDI